MIPRETKRLRDYEIMDKVLDRGDTEELARLLSVSPHNLIKPEINRCA